MRILFLMFFTQISVAQVAGIVKDSKTKAFISYVNIAVENKEKGVSANENGAFSLPKLNENDILIFSAVGYKPLKLKFKDIIGGVYLEQNILELKELSVTPRIGKKSLKIGKVNRKQINSFFASQGYPHIYGRFIPFTKNIAETRYIKEIRFLTRSKIRTTIFNVRLLTLNKEGEPIEYYSEQNIIGQCKKGMNITVVDVGNLNIKFPESGLLVGVEWILIERNKFIMQHQVKGHKTQKTEFSPWFGSDMEKDNNSWGRSSNSKWSKGMVYSHDIPLGHKGKYSTLAVELILTD